MVQPGADGLPVGVGSRHAQRQSADPTLRVRLHELVSVDQWRSLIEDYDAVLNCVGILRQRPGESYDRVHHVAPAALARACAGAGVRLVHVSALGLSRNARSRFLTSKLLGEDGKVARTHLLLHAQVF